MQESVDRLLQGCGSEQDLQEKITKLTSEWDVAVNNAVVNLWQYENMKKENIKLADEVSKLKKLQGSGETALIVQKLKQQIKEKDDQTQTQTPEVQQLVADLIMRGPDAPHTKKMMAATSTGKPTVAASTTKITAMMSTGIQPHQKPAMVTAPDPLQIISIDDDEPTLITDVTPMTTSVLDTAMMEDDESLRTKQLHLMQESVDKLLQGHGLEQDLQEKIIKLTSEWDVAVNNAAVNLWQYKSMQKENIKLAEEISKLKKLQDSGEMAPIIQKLKQ